MMVSAAIVVVAIAPWIVWWSSLPSDVATHWDLSGDPNGHLSRAVALAVLGGVSTALALGAAMRFRDLASPILAFVGCVIGSASLSTVLASRDEPSWTTAHLAPGWIGLGLALGAGAAWLYSRSVSTPVVPSTGDRPTLALSDSERVAWIGSSVSQLLRVVAFALLVFGAISLFTLPEPGGVIILLAALLVANFASAHVTVSRAGLRTSGTFGWPRVTIRIDRIASADAIDVNPMRWGGWGYRGSLRLMRRAAWVTRKGPGVHVVLTDGKEFVVTVDGAEEAAAVVNGLLATSTSR